MFNCKKILAVTDPTLDQQSSLLRALSIAEKTGAKIIALSCVYDKSYDMTAVLTSDERFDMKQAMVEHEKVKLDALVKRLKCESTVEVVITWYKKLHESVIDTCSEYKCDLIIKSTKKHGLLASTLFTPSDWHIVRNSSVDVLLVKYHEWPQGGTIVGSIGVSAKDNAHTCLSDKVAETAYALSQMLSASLHLANSFAGAPIHIAVEVPNFSPEVYNKSVQQRHTKTLQALGEKYKLDSTNIHVLEGLPEDIIPALCKKYSADLLVIGSVGRKGLSAALLGNTAELIIDGVECDTLVVKPTKDED
jgi:universal stress protein E